VLRAIAHRSHAKVSTLAMINLVFATILINSCNQYYEKECLLIPNNSIGWHFIIYDQNAFSTSRVTGRRIYKLLPNRIVFTNFDINDGILSSNDSTIIAFYCDSLYQIIKQLPVYIHADSQFIKKYKDSTMVFPLPPSGKGKYKIYPLYIDTLKNIYNYDHSMIPITESMIDSILLNK
jgi:hypothetical protein